MRGIAVFFGRFGGGQGGSGANGAIGVTVEPSVLSLAANQKPSRPKPLKMRSLPVLFEIVDQLRASLGGPFLPQGPSASGLPAPGGSGFSSRLATCAPLPPKTAGPSALCCVQPALALSTSSRRPRPRAKTWAMTARVPNDRAAGEPRFTQLSGQTARIDVQFWRCPSRPSQ